MFLPLYGEDQWLYSDTFLSLVNGLHHYRQLQAISLTVLNCGRRYNSDKFTSQTCFLMTVDNILYKKISALSINLSALEQAFQPFADALNLA